MHWSLFSDSLYHQAHLENQGAAKQSVITDLLAHLLAVSLGFLQLYRYSRSMSWCMSARSRRD